MKKVLAMMVLMLVAGTAQANEQDLSTLTKTELVKVTGKNLMRVGLVCPISNTTIVLAAIGETFPVVSSFASMVADIKTDQPGFGDPREFNITDKTVVSYSFGSISAVLGDLGVIAYNLIFDDSLPTDEMFRHTKTSYMATTALAKHFYGDDGECGIAGRTLIDVISEVNNRKSN